MELTIKDKNLLFLSFENTIICYEEEIKEEEKTKEWIPWILSSDDRIKELKKELEKYKETKEKFINYFS